ncbi:MAG TPA: hypothetical protein VF510_08485 [Ktedonobacterales bacterium]
MSVIVRYVYWTSHDAGGTLPPVDVVAGVLTRAAWRPLATWQPLEEHETLVIVPPQWIGDWESGRPLAPGYQHVWRVAVDRLASLPDTPRYGPYRPPTLPESATGPRTISPWRRNARGRTTAARRGSV